MEHLKALLAFVYAPNKLGLCGCRNEEIYRLLEKERWDGRDLERVNEFFDSFPVLGAYLSAISKANDWEKYSRKTVFAYLIGAPFKVYEQALPYLRGELKRIAHESKLKLVEKMPSMPLTHTSHVLYFRGIRRSGIADPYQIDLCKVSLGIVEGGYVIYDKFGGKGFGTGRAKVNLGFVGSSAKLVLHHYRFAFMEITRSEAELYLETMRKTSEVLGFEYPLDFFFAQI